jgi:probable addiction module antidote protein
MVTVAKWDAAEVLTSPERIAAYLEVALEDDDPEVLKVALGNIARAKGMAEIAKKAGIRRTSLYRALSPEGNPEFATVAGVLKALGLRLSVTQEGTTRRRAPARSRGATKAKSRTAGDAAAGSSPVSPGAPLPLMRKAVGLHDRRAVLALTDVAAEAERLAEGALFLSRKASR